MIYSWAALGDRRADRLYRLRGWESQFLRLLDHSGVKAYHILISGRVQGVGFRWFSERLAAQHEVVGYVRNLPDGRVEVLAQADEEVLVAFCERLREGPASSQTDEFIVKPVPPNSNLRDFDVRF